MIEIEHNVSTGQIIEKSISSEELQQRKLDEQKAFEILKKTEELATKRQLLLEKLGITEEEAKLLLS